VKQHMHLLATSKTRKRNYCKEHICAYLHNAQNSWNSEKDKFM